MEAVIGPGSNDGRSVRRGADSPGGALREHWPEFLIEGWALGCFMISVGVFVVALYSPESRINVLIPNASTRAVLLGLALGTTAILLIHSPWGKRSGAHMNPAVTLAFLSFRKIHLWDASFFVIAQVIGATPGVFLVAAIARSLFSNPPVRYAVTARGARGHSCFSWRKRCFRLDSCLRCWCFPHPRDWPAQPELPLVACWPCTSVSRCLFPGQA
jgi:hypothetical protein